MLKNTESNPLSGIWMHFWHYCLEYIKMKRSRRTCEKEVVLNPLFSVVLLLCKLPLLMKAIHSFSLFPFSLGLESWTSTENSWLFCFDLCFLHNHNQGISHFDRLYSWTDHVSYLQEWVMHGICLQTHLVLPMQSSWDPETFPQMIGHQCGSWRQMSWHMSPCVPVRCMTSGTPSLASPLT